MRRVLLLSLCTLFFGPLANAQTFDWVTTTSGVSGKIVTAITLDSNENIYVVGRFYGTANFESNSTNASLISNGNSDFYIQKLDSGGNLIWVKGTGGMYEESAMDVAVDDSGNVYTIGRFIGTTDFDPGSGTFNVTSNGSFDIFIQKLDANGDFVWVKTMGSTQKDEGTSIALDKQGNVYSVGFYRHTIDLDPGTGTQTATSYFGTPNFYIQKLNANGDLIWVKTIGDGEQEDEEAHAIAVDDSGFVYITGMFDGNYIDFDPGPNTNAISAITADDDVFALKLDTSGNFVWVRSIKGPLNDRANAITVDDSGNVYVAGNYNGQINFTPNQGPSTISNGGSDVFVWKLDKNGDLIWGKSSGSSNSDMANSIVVDQNHEVYVTGFFTDTADFDPDTTVHLLISHGRLDIFQQKLSANGDLIWAYGYGSPKSDQGIGIAVSPQGNIYSTGIYSDSVDFDPSIDTVPLISPGAAEMYVQKLGQCIIDQSVTVNDPFMTANAVGTQYQWLDCNNSYAIIPGATMKTFVPTANGTYAVEISRSNCIDTSDCFTINTIGLKELSNRGKNTFVYPNPGNGRFFVQFEKEIEADIRIVNTNGQLIYTESGIFNGEYEIDLDGITGLYILEVKWSNDVEYHRLIIQKN